MLVVNYSDIRKVQDVPDCIIIKGIEESCELIEALCKYTTNVTFWNSVRPSYRKFFNIVEELNDVLFCVSEISNFNIFNILDDRNQYNKSSLDTIHKLNELIDQIQKRDIKFDTVNDILNYIWTSIISLSNVYEKFFIDILYKYKNNRKSRYELLYKIYLQGKDLSDDDKKIIFQKVKIIKKTKDLIPDEYRIKLNKEQKLIMYNEQITQRKGDKK